MEQPNAPRTASRSRHMSHAATFAPTESAPLSGSVRKNQVYGSYKAQSARGRLAELRTLFTIQKRRFRYLLLASFAGWLLWPIAAVLLPGLALSVALGMTRFRAASGLAALIVAVAIILFTIPAACLASSSVLRHDVMSGQFRHVSILDFMNLAIDHLQVLVFFAFIVVSHEIIIEVNMAKEQVQEYWKTQSQKKGMVLHLNDDQRGAMAAAGYKKFQDDLSAELKVWEFINTVLAQFPGWETGTEFCNEEEEGKVEQSGIKECLSTRMKMQSQDTATIKRGLNVLDLYVLRLRHESMWDFLGADIVLAKANFFVSFLKVMFQETPGSCSAMATIALLRASLPRFWSYFALSGTFFPETPAACVFVVYGSCVTALITYFWCVVCLSTHQAYQHNAVQMRMTEGLIDVERRADYAAHVAKTCSLEEAERLMGMLPLLDLRDTTNVLAFWRIRQFVLLDQMNERMMAQMILEILMGWLAMNIFMVLLAIFGVGVVVSDIGCLMVLDLVCAGWFTVVMLQTSIKINQVVEGAANALVEVRHDLLLRRYGDMEEGEEETGDSLEGLLSHLIEKIDRNDEKQRLLFDVEITPLNLFALIGSICFAIFGIFEQFVSLGIITNVVKTEGAFFVQAKTFGEKTLHASFFTHLLESKTFR